MKEVGGATSLTMRVARAGLENWHIGYVGLELSEDGGETWRSLGGITIGGGEARGRDGKLLTHSEYRVALLDHGGEPIPFVDGALVRVASEHDLSVEVIAS